MNYTSAEILFEKFEIIDCLKKDEHSGVYISNHIFLGKKIILKTLNTSGLSDKSILHRFKREAKIMARLDHPNLIKVLDFGSYLNFFYISFEYFESKNLRQLIIENSLTTAEKTQLFYQLLRALDAAHRNSVIHRDIKPENILVDASMHLKIADFGLALILNDNSVTNKSSIVGTPGYMSPEQIKGLELSSATDIFSSGLVAYELFTGFNPLIGKDIGQTINNIVNFKETAFWHPEPDIPADIKNLLKQMLVKDLKNRTHSAASLLSEKNDTNGKVLEPAAELVKNNKISPGIIYASAAVILLLIIAFLFYPSKAEKLPETDTVSEIIQSPLENLISSESEAQNQAAAEESNTNPPAEADPPAVTTGRLMVECIPWAAVYIDNKKLDTTPLNDFITLDKGTYNLRLEHPDFPDYTKTIKIQSGKEQTVRVNFNEIVGFLDCNKISPWGEVYIDGRLAGTTPFRAPIPLLEGRHKIEVNNPQYGKIESVVDIKAKETFQFRHVFTAASAADKGDE